MKKSQRAKPGEKKGRGKRRVKKNKKLLLLHVGEQFTDWLSNC
jgi:hypothetical protein